MARPLGLRARHRRASDKLSYVLRKSKAYVVVALGPDNMLACIADCTRLRSVHDWRQKFLQRMRFDAANKIDELNAKTVREHLESRQAVSARAAIAARSKELESYALPEDAHAAVQPGQGSVGRPLESGIPEQPVQRAAV